MKTFWSILLFFSCLAFFSIGDAVAKKPSPKGEKVKTVKRLSHSGDIEGTVVCREEAEDVDLDGTLVNVSGLSIMAITDATGDFHLLNVPKGSNDVVFKVPGMLSESVSVEVIKKRVTDLDIIELECVPEPES